MTSVNELSLKNRLEKRKGTMSEVDRNHFEKEQTECISKGIKNEEVAAKEKHVRRAIIGTWQERGNSMFWSIIGKQPLPSQVILCWKALFVLHKILRDGHPNVLKDSYVYRKTLRDLFSVYRFQAGTYGPLVCEYLKILQTKLELHHKYPGIPGHLSFSQDNPIKIPEKDINDIFTFAVESLDYQDLMLAFQENILKTLDKSKNNSQIASSQCRLAVLVPMLKECSGMYDLLVYVLTKLHKNLPPDTLEGHRDRFHKQHKRMKTFCMESSAFEYITNLTSIPSIPEYPPDFLIHKFQPKMKKEKPKEEPKTVQLLPKVDERDILIEQLMKEIDDLRNQLQLAETQYADMENRLRMQIMKLQEELNTMQNFAKQSSQENKFLKEQLDHNDKEDSELQEKAKSADDKFNKLKNIYGKLRQDHIELLRKSGETKQKEEANEKKLKELQDLINSTNEELKSKNSEIEALTNCLVEMDADNQKLKIEFDSTDEAKNAKLLSQGEEVKQLEKTLTESLASSEALRKEFDDVKNQSEKQVAFLQGQLRDLTQGKISEETARKNTDEESRKHMEELNGKIADLNSEIARLTNENSNHLQEKIKMESSYKELQESSSGQLIKLNDDLQALQKSKEHVVAEKQMVEENFLESKISLEQQINVQQKEHDDEVLRSKLLLLSSTSRECQQIITDTLQIFSDPNHQSSTTCTAGYLALKLQQLNDKINNSTSSYGAFYQDKQDVLPVLKHLNTTCHRISDALIHGKATSHMGAEEDSHKLVLSCKTVGEKTLKYLKDFEDNSEPTLITSDGDALQAEISSLIKTSEELASKDEGAGNTDNIVNEEIHATEQVVADAASRIEEMLKKSRKTHSGVQLEVNERILDSCTGLMKAIRELIIKSKDLQEEIVAQGRGSASVKEFYKRHHKWTEGLLSAAKSVGYGATILVDAADKVIERKGKFEELIVASHEIAASTAQLVAASRVKAAKNSKKLPPLMTASKGVGEATAGVVAAVRSGADMTEESKAVPDYTKMSLTQAKRYEMDSQVRIHELENDLQKERAKLGQLRKAHYQIAVELYGEEQVEMGV